VLDLGARHPNGRRRGRVANPISTRVRHRRIGSRSSVASEELMQRFLFEEATGEVFMFDELFADSATRRNRGTRISVSATAPDERILQRC